MITINIAILIQAINFIIAYIIIRTLLIKPTVAVILEEQEHRDGLMRTMVDLTKENSAKEEKMKSRWSLCRQEFAAHTPPVKETEQELRKEVTTTVPAPKELDKKAVGPLVDSVAQSLVERISHVR